MCMGHRYKNIETCLSTQEKMQSILKWNSGSNLFSAQQLVDQTSETSSLPNNNVNIEYRKYQDPIFQTRGQVYMSEQGIQKFICLNMKKSKSTPY